jgi:mitochondrial fission protein ELM1
VADALLGEGVRVLVLGSGTIGHENNALGVAEALGALFELRRVEPRALFARLAPYGPVDPRDKPGAAGSIFPHPLPDVAISSGRVTVPYIRALKRAGGRRLFAVFLQDPRHARSEMDLIWVPEHDSLRGANVVTTLTSPHPFSPERIAAARAAPDARLASLPGPRCAVVLGGPSGAEHFTPADVARLGDAIRVIAAQGFSVMATPSRRTPPELLAAVRDGLGAAPGFVWDGQGENPYLAILALADALLVTGDSANMVGEAAATGAPVHIFEPSGGESRKRAGSIDALVRIGAARRFSGSLERFSYEPIDSSGRIAAEIARRFRAGRERAG